MINITYAAIKPALDRIELELQPLIDELKPLTQLEQMEADYLNLQLSDADWEQPFARLTDEQRDELEEERPGEELCLSPWNW